MPLIINKKINRINQLKKQACLLYGERGRERSGKNTNERLEKYIVTKRDSLYGAKREIERGDEA